ncbi:MAG TPA: DUF2071 domain-containing protein [Nocardioidaceae bacterium]|nr:DUF2071 domain-containing protein [Nocardioidaceae bacterium]
MPGAATPEPISPVPPGLSGRPIMHQRWVDVAFLHWRIDPARVAPLLPPGTTPDVYDGDSWVGLIPFRMVGAGIASGPAVPWLGTFAETNVRLYSVDRGGRRGVVFRSLDASRLGVVIGARVTFGLRYCWAKMRVRATGADLEYTTVRRRWPGGRGVSSRAVVRPGAALSTSDPLADFLTARWGLHTRWAGRSVFVPNEHERWPLHSATLQHLEEDQVAAAGLPGVTTRPPDSVLWSPGVTARFGMPLLDRR